MAGQIWSVNSLGGYMYSDELSDVLRIAVQPVVKFRQFCDAKDATEKGLHRGDQYNWNVYSDTSKDGGELNEQEVIPEGDFSVTQQSLTITEYGNSVPFSGKLDDLSKHPVTEIIHKVLKNDCKKTIDGAAFNQFNLTNLKAYGNSGSEVTIDDDASGAVQNNTALLKFHVKEIVDTMKERNIPPYEGDDYFALAWPTTYRLFKNELEDVYKYVETGFTLVRNGEIGRYEGVRFCEQTNIAKGGAEDETGWTFRTVGDSWTNGHDWCFFMGEDTVAEAIAIPEEIRGRIPSDYGRSRGVAWYYLGGFGIVHGPNGSASEQRILKWDSAD